VVNRQNIIAVSDSFGTLAGTSSLMTGMIRVRWRPISGIATCGLLQGTALAPDRFAKFWQD
jgi:hypothetical protein